MSSKTYHLPLLGSAQYQNPLLFQNPEQTNPDPSILRWCGRYYCYASSANGVQVSLSDDLVHWEYCGYAIQEPGQQEYWAPCAYYHNGVFYLYYSTAPQGQFDCHQERLRVATSTNPTQGFMLQKVLFDTFSIDAHVVRDATAQLWLFYSVNHTLGCDENAAGTVILADRLLDPLTPEGTPRPVVLPTLPEEVFEKNRFGDGRDWHTIEGAFYLHHQNTGYLMYSANAYVHENYFVGWSHAQGPNNISALRWNKFPGEHLWEPLIRRNKAVEGTGHNSVIPAPNLVDQWVVYHGRHTQEERIQEREQRQMRMDELLFDGGRLATNAPSWLPQNAPAAPLVFDRLETPNPTLWETVQGTFVKGGLGLQSETTKGCSIAKLRPQSPQYVLEVTLQAAPTHMGARYGVMLWFEDLLNCLEARLDEGQRTLSLLLTRGGIQTQMACVNVDSTFRFTVPHCLLARRRFDQFDLSLNDIPQISLRVPLPTGRVALFTRHTLASFAAFTLTNSVSLWGSTLDLLPGLYRADHPLRNEAGGIQNLSPSPARLSAIHCPLQPCRIEVEFELLTRAAKVEFTAQTEGASLCLCATHTAAQTITTVAGKREAFALKLPHPRFTLRLVCGAECAYLWIQGHIVLLPAPLLPMQSHTLLLQGAAIRSVQHTELHE